MNVFYVPCFVFLLSMTLVPSMIVLYNAILVEAKAFSNDKELFERVNSGEMIFIPTLLPIHECFKKNSMKVS